MNPRALTTALLIVLCSAASATEPKALELSRQLVRKADYRATGRMVRVEAGGKRMSFGISLRAHWFGTGLKVAVEVNSPANARVHALIEMQPGGKNTILVAHPGDKLPMSLPFERWTEGPAGEAFSWEDLMEDALFWAGQQDAGAANYGARTCQLVRSTPAGEDRSHYSQVSSWLDATTGFPAHVEKTEKGSGHVKEFTYMGIHQSFGVWFANQIESRVRGKEGEVILIIERGSPAAHLTEKDFANDQITRFQEAK